MDFKPGEILWDTLHERWVEYIRPIPGYAMPMADIRQLSIPRRRARYYCFKTHDITRYFIRVTPLYAALHGIPLPTVPIRGRLDKWKQIIKSLWQR